MDHRGRDRNQAERPGLDELVTRGHRPVIAMAEPARYEIRLLVPPDQRGVVAHQDQCPVNSRAGDPVVGPSGPSIRSAKVISYPGHGAER